MPALASSGSLIAPWNPPFHSTTFLSSGCTPSRDEATSVRSQRLLSSSTSTPSSFMNVEGVKKGVGSLTKKKYDAVVVGGGHNGLVAGFYLAQAGKKVLVVERRHIIGGAAVTEELVPGFKFSRCSYCLSLLRPQIMKDLKLLSHGMTILPRNPSTFSPLHNGKYLMLGPDAAFNQKEIAKFSEKDAAAYPQYEAMLERLFLWFEPLMDLPPVDPLAKDSKFQQLTSAVKAAGGLLKLGRDLPNMLEMVSSPATKILRRWFESEPLISKLATDAVTGAFMGPSTPGSGAVLFHHCMGDVGYGRGVWAYVKGGMGAVSQAIARAAIAQGVDIVTEAPVKNVLIDQQSGAAKGVVLDDGTQIDASVVLSNCDPQRTFGLVGDDNMKKFADKEFRERIKSYDYASATFKINLAVDKLPNFTCAPNNKDNTPGPQHRGTIHFLENTEQLDEAYADAVNGHPSKRPFIEMTIPSSLDDSVAPPGQHVVQLFVQYAPYKLAQGSWDDPGRKEKFAQSCYDVIEEYAPGFTKSIIGADLLSPVDLERTFGLTGGNIFHGSMAVDQLYWLRPVAGYSRYATPFKNLFICGSGAHPGGGVMGASGRNAALTALASFK